MKQVTLKSIWLGLLFIIVIMSRCSESSTTSLGNLEGAETNSPEYYLFRPELEKAYGYSHAVRIEDDIKISGAVSMGSAGNLLAAGNLEQQMKNCYSDLEKILAHYNCTFDDVVVENIFTTNMQEFIKVSGYRSNLYKKHFPTGSWIGVKELALPGQLIEIEMEVHKAK